MAIQQLWRSVKFLGKDTGGGASLTMRSCKISLTELLWVHCQFYRTNLLSHLSTPSPLNVRTKYWALIRSRNRMACTDYTQLVVVYKFFNCIFPIAPDTYTSLVIWNKVKQCGDSEPKISEDWVLFTSRAWNSQQMVFPLLYSLCSCSFIHRLLFGQSILWVVRNDAISLLQVRGLVESFIELWLDE